MTENTARGINYKTASEERNVAIDFSGKLDSGELLTGTPTIVEVGSSDLTLSNKVVNTSTLTINGESTVAGEAVQFKVTGGSANTKYTIKISCSTDATPTQVLLGSITLNVIADS